jgi:hypothetical protein
MTRIDYRVSRYERLLGVAPPSAPAAQTRGPLLALLGTLAVFGFLAGIQHSRLARVQRDVARVSVRLALDDDALRRLAILEGDVRRLRALDDEIGRVAATGAQSAGEVTAIGNEIPAQAWLSSIRRLHDGYALEGQARDVALVGRMLAGLRPVGPARLSSVQQAPLGRDVSYAISVRSAR